jgi:hypothetical protein
VAGVADINAGRSVAVATLRRRANAAWRAYRAARRERLVAELREHDHATEQNLRQLELARSDERSARSAWRKAEEDVRTAETGRKAA